MKLKKMFLIGLFLIPMLSCEKREDIDTVEIKTDLNVDIVVIAESNDTIPLKSRATDTGYLFNGTGIFCLAQNVELGKTSCEIKKVKPHNGSILTFSGITAGNEITSLLIKWDSKPKDSGEFDMQNKIDITSLVKDPKNGSYEIDMTIVLLPLINCIDSNPDCMYRIDVEGTSNFDISSTAKLKIPVVVETNAFSSRFTLF